MCTALNLSRNEKNEKVIYHQKRKRMHVKTMSLSCSISLKDDKRESSGIEKGGGGEEGIDFLPKAIKDKNGLR